MKKCIFIGNRLPVLEVLQTYTNLQVELILALKDSPLHQHLTKHQITHQVFELTKAGKEKVLKILDEKPYDLLIVNGCPFVLPIQKLKESHPNSLYINTHPTLLPELKGKTPINGVVYLNHKTFGATTHYMDDGIDTGPILAQVAEEVTSDLDLGLIYYISFQLEGVAFKTALDQLIHHDFHFAGTQQNKSGTYFNREPELFEIDWQKDSNQTIIKKIKSVGIPSQGTTYTFKSESYLLVDAEVVFNPYLLSKFNNYESGHRLLEYGNNLLIKTLEGIIKVTHTSKKYGK